MVVRLYRNTGFNAIDIPDSPQMLEQNFSYFKQYANVNIQQINNLSFVKVELDEMLAREVDYVVIIDSNTQENKNIAMYTVDGFVMEAPGVCTLQLREDSYNTLGGFSNPDLPYGPKTHSGNTIIAGSANRLSISVAEDNELYYNAEEPFVPSKPSDVQLKPLNTLSGKKIKIVEVTALPPGYTIDEYFGEEPVDVEEGITAKIKKGISSGWRIITRPFSHDAVVVENDGEYQVNLADVNSLKARRINETTVKLVTPNEDEIEINTGTSYFVIDDTGMYPYSDKANITYLLSGEGTGLNLKREQHDLLMDMNEADMVDAIVGYWEVPVEYVAGYYIPGDKQYVAKWEALHDEEQPVMGTTQMYASCIRPQLVASYPPNLYNNKAKYGQSFTITVFSPASGEKITKLVSEIVGDKPGDVHTEIDPVSGEEVTYNYKLQYAIVSDPRRGGSPIFMWRYVAPGSEQVATPMEYIKGLTWRTVPLRVSGVTGELFDRMRMNQNKGNIIAAGIGVALTGFHPTTVVTESQEPEIGQDPSDLFTYGLPTGNMITKQTKAPGIGFNSFRGIAGAGVIAGGLWKIMQQNEILNARGEAAGANIQIGDSNYMRDIDMNTFIMACARYNNWDLHDFDTFLTRFGYNVGNRPITDADLYSRPGFNFIRINDMSIKSIGANSNLQNRVVNQLKNGVRLWHRAPNRNDMLAGGNR